MAGDSTSSDNTTSEGTEGSVEMGDIEVYGSPSPTSNGVSDAISSLD